MSTTKHEVAGIAGWGNHRAVIERIDDDRFCTISYREIIAPHDCPDCDGWLEDDYYRGHMRFCESCFGTGRITERVVTTTRRVRLGELTDAPPRRQIDLHPATVGLLGTAGRRRS